MTMPQNLTLNLFYKGQAATEVPEYAEVELRLTSRAADPVTNLSLWLGDLRLRESLTIRPASEFVMLFSVSDWVGELRFEVRQDQQVLAQTPLTVIPRKLTLPEVQWIKTDRLPTLLARLDAPNSFRLSYGSDEPEQPPFNFISLDYTALKLRYYCQLFLQNGLAERLIQRLDFAVAEETRREEGFIRGAVRWNPTVQGWASRPVETGLVHQWVETTRQYDQPLNRLLVFFWQELTAELQRLVKLVRQGVPASARLKAELAEFEGYATELPHLWQTAALRSVVAYLTSQPFEPDVQALEQQAGHIPNPAYQPLVEAWKSYRGQYVRLPQEEGSPVGLQPMSKIYELWVACEVAYALGLTFADATEVGLESATFKNDHWLLYYNQGAEAGWYSSQARQQPPRPDLRIIAVASQTTYLLDVKYRIGRNNHALPDDMYRMLAYMNDFGVSRGGIIFPGTAPEPQLALIEQPGQQAQVLAELGLRPPAADLVSWEASLKANLDHFFQLD